MKGISIYLFFLGVICSMFACMPEKEEGRINSIPVIPDFEVNAESELLERKRGVLHYEGLPFSGKLISLYEDGKLASRTPYFEGKEHGFSEGWHPNGIKRFERTYERGAKTGIHKGWWENGQLKYIRHLANDVFEGNVREWYSNGHPFMDFNYVNGQELGSQKAWKSDGRIKVNYVVKNGRKYGLTGVKNCISLVE